MRYLALVIAPLLISLSGLNAQEPVQLEPGVRVRLSTAPQGNRPEWMVGTVITVTADRLTIRGDTDSAREIEVARDALTRLQVSRGKRSNALTGLALGFVVGTGVGAAIGYATLHDGYDLSPWNAALVGAVPGALIGGSIGLGVGARLKGERWHEIPVTLDAMDGFRHPLRISLNFRFPTR